MGLTAVCPGITHARFGSRSLRSRRKSMFRSRVSPMSAFARGFVAGAAGAGGEAIFFRIMRGSTLHDSNGASGSFSQTEPRHDEEKKADKMVRQLRGGWREG